MRAPVPQHALSAGDVKRLRRRYRLRRELAQVVAQRPPSRRSDLLDRDDVTSIATADELRLLMRESRVDPDTPLAEAVQRTAVVVHDGVVIGVYDLERTRRAYLADARSEIISAELDPTSRLGVRISTVQLLGWTLGECGALDDAEREKGQAHLNALRGTRAHELWREKEIPTPADVSARVFQVLSALLDAVVYMTCPRHYSAVKGGGSTPDVSPTGPGTVTIEPPGIKPPEQVGAQCGPGSGWLADLVPELNIGDCCAAHDACYGRGCTSCDKARCDKEFYECILPKAGPAIATLYYDAVAAFGQGAFNYCDGRWGLGGTLAIGAGIAVGVAVGVSFGPAWGVAAGTLVAVGSIALQGALCQVCEAVKRWECTAREERRYRECAERKEKRKKRCRKWPKGFRWLCRAWTYISYWVCVAWTWIVTRLCTAWQWVIITFTC